MVEERPSDEAGHPKWKRVPRQMPDALNGCLCGIVVVSQSNGVLECKKLGCETRGPKDLKNYTGSVNFFKHL